MTLKKCVRVRSGKSSGKTHFRGSISGNLVSSYDLVRENLFNVAVGFVNVFMENSHLIMIVEVSIKSWFWNH